MPSHPTSCSRRLVRTMAPTPKTLFAPRFIRAEGVRIVENCATTEGITVAAVEDDERMRQALVFQIATAGLEVASYASAEEFLEAANAKEFDCIVVDINLPKMNGLQLQEELNRTVPFASIVFITGHGDLSLGMHAMRKGAVDFLEKPIDDETLLSSIARGADLSRKRRAEHIQRIELEKRHGCLTPREREVFGLITTGFLNKQVGAELGTTERTVKAHRERVMSKMGAGSLADLVRMAGILQIQSARTQSARMR
jgi:two-component system, LuxR family, response regulator FixJ